MNRHFHRIAWLGWITALLLAPAAHAQRRPYIGFAYPAGGQQATTVQMRLGGQDLDDVNAVLVTGSGVTARIVEYDRRLGNQEVQLLNEQLKELKRKAAAPAMAPEMAPAMAAEPPMMAEMAAQPAPSGPRDGEPGLSAKIERRVREAVQTPACAALANIVLVELRIDAGATPGARELRLVTLRGVSNPLPFHVGQLPESVRKPMVSANLQILGKEAAALRKRPAEEAEERITLPRTVNGQIASGEINRYRFQASKGQRLVISTQARQLIPYIADAVPGWFQPVLALYDGTGREVAYSDDYRFKPDPVILFQVPQDGDYVFAIYDGIYRGREDFVYRITVGDLPFVTSLFPMGGPADAPRPPAMTGSGLAGAQLDAPSADARPGVLSLAASKAGYVSNRVPFVLESLPEELEREPNDTLATAQKVTLPVIINGRIGHRDDWDVFQFIGKADDPLVIEVQARRLDSPLDSVVKLTDATGKVLAFNDDCEDLTAGINTHHADSYLMTRLPADGIYFVHIGDTARNSGDEYGYRLRLSAPQPDFELRVVPSSASLAVNSSATVTVYAVRKDGFSGPIQLTLKNPAPGFSAVPVVIPANQPFAKLTLKSGPAAPPALVELAVVGSATLGGLAIVRDAVPAEDRMQAFLWRHLVPANDLRVLVFDPKAQPPPKRVPPARPPPKSPATPSATPPVAGAAVVAAGSPPAVVPPKFTKQQIEGRLRQLKLLYQEGLLTDAFYDAKATECEAGQ